MLQLPLQLAPQSNKLNLYFLEICFSKLTFLGIYMTLHYFLGVREQIKHPWGNKYIETTTKTWTQTPNLAAQIPVRLRKLLTSTVWGKLTWESRTLFEAVSHMFHCVPLIYTLYLPCGALNMIFSKKQYMQLEYFGGAPKKKIKQMKSVKNKNKNENIISGLNQLHFCMLKLLRLFIVPLIIIIKLLWLKCKTWQKCSCASVLNLTRQS